MILVITEKTTQKNKFCSILKNVKHNRFYSEGSYNNKRIVVTALSGHIFNIPDLSVFDKRFKDKSFKKTKDILPVYPPCDTFYPRILSDKKYKDLFETIKIFVQKSDGIILAPDPDFEGAALEFEVLFYIKNALKKIIAMMDMNNLNLNVLKKEFEKALNKKGLDYKTMAYIGLLREDLNYGVGINTSRYLIGVFEKKTTFGTQQSRLIDLIIKRTNEYFAFKKRKYYILKIKTDIGDFVLQLKNEKDKFNKDFIEEIRARINNITDIPVQNIKKEIKKIPPLKWFDGSDVAQEAAKILKIPAVKLMDEKTGLLEKMYLDNILTYPRGESKNIMPLSELENQIAIAKKIAPFYNAAECDFNLIKKDLWYNDNTKSLGVNHTPFTVAKADIDISLLSFKEKVIFDIVAKRLLSIFYPDPQVLIKTINVNIKGFDFRLKEISDIRLGWKKLYDKKEQKTVIPDNIKTAKVKKIEIEEEKTKPLPLFTLNSVLKEMKKHKIGAESTYKQLIEKITDRQRPYIEIKEGKLIPTEFAKKFFNIIPDDAVNILNSFEEHIVKELLNKKISYANAFKKRNEMIEKVFNLIKKEIDKKTDYLIEILKKENELKIVGKCPLCGGDVVEKDKYFSCIKRKVKKINNNWENLGCPFLIFKKIETVNMRILINKNTATELLKNKKVKIKAYSKNKKKFFMMELFLKNGKIEFIF